MKTAVIAVGDLHVNSTVAISKPVVNLDDGGTYRASKSQRALWYSWLDFWQSVEELDVDRRVLVLKGDIGELDAKRRSTQLITINKATVLSMVIDVLEPALMLADRIIVIRGTMAHTGKSGWLEETLADDLDNVIHNEHSASWWHFRGTVEGVRFDISHHAQMGGLPWTEKNAANKIASIIEHRYAVKMKQPIPHIALRSHNHKRSDSGDNSECLAVCLPCWSSTTEFGYRIGRENDLPDIGGDVYICENGEYQRTAYKYKPTQPRRIWSLKI